MVLVSRRLSPIDIGNDGSCLIVLADIFFLNRPALRHVKSSEELLPAFAIPPQGRRVDEDD